MPMIDGGVVMCARGLQSQCLLIALGIKQGHRFAFDQEQSLFICISDVHEQLAAVFKQSWER